MTAPPPPRILAIDLGTRRIGVAITDALGIAAQPLLTMARSNDRRFKPEIRNFARLVRRYEVAEVVVGQPLHLSGDPSAGSARAQQFAAALGQQLGIPVHLVDERLSTAEAHQRLAAAGCPDNERERIVDQVAAAIILETFLQERAYRLARGTDG